MIILEKSKNNKIYTLFVNEVDRLHKDNGSHISQEVKTYTDDKFQKIRLYDAADTNTLISEFKNIGYSEVEHSRIYTCWKCNGTGHFDHWSHIANGDCFACGGNGLKIRK